MTDPQATPGRPLAALRVLVVEDHQDTADSTAELLRLYGHQVEIARDGPAALAAASRFAPDVVLLDIGLPGVDGYEVSRRLKDLPWERRPFVVAVTGYATEEDRRRSAEAGIDVHLAKPADPTFVEDLLQRFRQFLGR